MATSLLSLMALSGYVSAMLPPTEIITVRGTLLLCVLRSF